MGYPGAKRLWWRGTEGIELMSSCAYAPYHCDIMHQRHQIAFPLIPPSSNLQHPVYPHHVLFGALPSKPYLAGGADTPPAYHRPITMGKISILFLYRHAEVYLETDHFS